LALVLPFWEKAGIHLMVRLHTQFSDEEIMTRAAKVVFVSAIAISQSGKGEFIFFGYGELTRFR